MQTLTHSQTRLLSLLERGFTTQRIVEITGWTLNGVHQLAFQIRRRGYTLPKKNKRAAPSELTNRQRDCMVLQSKGRTYSQIAAELGISTGTVAAYLASGRTRQRTAKALENTMSDPMF